MRASKCAGEKKRWTRHEAGGIQRASRASESAAQVRVASSPVSAGAIDVGRNCLAMSSDCQESSGAPGALCIPSLRI